MQSWTIKQGNSRATVRAETHADACSRAAQIGFDAPDSVVLNEAPPAPQLRPVRVHFTDGRYAATVCDGDALSTAARAIGAGSAAGSRPRVSHFEDMQG